MSKPTPLPGAAAVTVPDSQRAEAAAATLPPPAAEPAKAVKPDRVAEMLSPAARKVLASRQPAAAKEAPGTPKPAAALPEQKPAATPAPEDGSKAKPGDEAKKDEPTPDAGVIDFSELGKVETPNEEGDTPPIELTDAELADLTVVKKKIKEAHKDNATLRKQRTEAREAKEKLEAELTTLREELATAQASKAPSSSHALDKYASAQEVENAREDALTTLQRLVEDPEADHVILPGNRRWDLKTPEAQQSAKALCLEILSGYDAKVKQLGQRADAEKLVAERLPLLKKAVPDFESRYKKALALDWASEAPRISLQAALGELVVNGDYVLMPRKAAAQTPKPKAEAKPAEQELPQAQPPVREIATAGPDLTALKQKALKGGKEGQAALQEWIKLSAKAPAKARA